MWLSTVRASGSLLTCLLLAGCSGAEWQKLEVDSGYQPPKAITIALAAPRSMQEASDAMTSALIDDLDSHGIKATLVRESIGSDADLSVVKWDPGSRSMRWLVGFGEGKGEIFVQLQSAFGVDGTAHGWVKGGGFGGDSANAAEAAGHLIAYTIATGLREPPQRPSGAKH